MRWHISSTKNIQMTAFYLCALHIQRIGTGFWRSCLKFILSRDIDICRRSNLNSDSDQKQSALFVQVLHIKTLWKQIRKVQKRAWNKCSIHSMSLFCFLSEELFVIQPTPLGFSVNVLSLILSLSFLLSPRWLWADRGMSLWRKKSTLCQSLQVSLHIPTSSKADTAMRNLEKKRKLK